MTAPRQQDIEPRDRFNVQQPLYTGGSSVTLRLELMTRRPPTKLLWPTLGISLPLGHGRRSHDRGLEKKPARAFRVMGLTPGISSGAC
ncbi:hypothetical protein TNCV_1184561 [Trichonephila clavipes]|nr:hypothetical protein TNCV_1184561 [Trichonephila clavipes]